jgi:HK97 family phage major capsid protein
MSTEVQELGKQLTELRGAHAERIKKLKEAPAEQKAALFEEVNKAEEELGQVHDKWVKARSIEDIEKRNEEQLKYLNEAASSVPFPSGDPAGVDESKAASANRIPANFRGLGDALINSKAFRESRGDSRPEFAIDIPGVSLKTALIARHRRDMGMDGGAVWGGNVEVKATMSTTAGILPYPPQQADVVPIARRRPTVADLMPQTDTQASSIIYLEQTTATNGAATVAEGATKPQSTLVWTRRTVPLEVIAHLLPITNQQLEDVDGIRDIVDQELVELLRLSEEAQILNGSGTSPDLQGILTKTGVQTQAKGADDIFTAAMRAFTLVRHTGFADVTAGVMHPNDWLAYVTAQDSTGRFIYGNPAEAVQPRLWGVPIVVTTAMTENTGLFGDFSLYTRLWRKGGIRLEVGYVNDDFAKNQQTLRCEERVALQIRRPSAFVKLTGI